MDDTDDTDDTGAPTRTGVAGGTPPTPKETKRTAFTKEEDDRLREAFERYSYDGQKVDGSAYDNIVKHVKTRSKKQCQNRAQKLKLFVTSKKRPNNSETLQGHVNHLPRNNPQIQVHPGLLYPMNVHPSRMNSLWLPNAPYQTQLGDLAPSAKAKKPEPKNKKLKAPPPQRDSSTSTEVAQTNAQTPPTQQLQRHHREKEQQLRKEHQEQLQGLQLQLQGLQLQLQEQKKVHARVGRFITGNEQFGDDPNVGTTCRLCDAEFQSKETKPFVKCVINPDGKCYGCFDCFHQYYIDKLLDQHNFPKDDFENRKKFRESFRCPFCHHTPNHTQIKFIPCIIKGNAHLKIQRDQYDEIDQLRQHQDHFMESPAEAASRHEAEMAEAAVIAGQGGENGQVSGENGQAHANNEGGTEREIIDLIDDD